MATIFRGGTVSRADAVRQRRDMMMVLKLLQSAVDRMFDLSGTHGLLGNSAIQRHWRDLHAINMHGLLNLETNMEMYGRVLLGLTPNTPLI